MSAVISETFCWLSLHSSYIDISSSEDSDERQEKSAILTLQVVVMAFS